jgi:competence protein ComFC
MKLSGTLSGKLSKLTSRPVCKICFGDIRRDTLLTFFNSSPCLCPDCFNKINYSFSRGKIGTVSILSLAEYKQPLSELLIRYKETLDVELAPVFLSYYAPYLKAVYDGYTIVEVPSSKSKLEKRGFDHLKLIFSPLGLPFADVLFKDEGTEQKKNNALERREAGKLFHLKEPTDLSKKKILLVDDVITTGSSLKACLGLIKQCHPKKIKILVLMNDSPLSSYS